MVTIGERQMEELKKSIYEMYLNVLHAIDGANDVIANTKLKGINKQKDVANLQGQIKAYEDVRDMILYDIMKKPRS